MKLTLNEGGYDWRFLPIIGKTSTDSGTASCHGKPLNLPPPPPHPDEPRGRAARAASVLDRSDVLRLADRLGHQPGDAGPALADGSEGTQHAHAGPARARSRRRPTTANLVMNRAGTAAAPITVEPYPGERAVLASAGSHPLRVDSGGAYFRLRGFVIQGYPLSTGGAVDLHGHHLEISNNEITGSTNHAIYTDEPSHHIQLLANRIHHNGQGLAEQSHGIYLQGNDHLVASNVIHDQPHGFGIQLYDRASRAMVVGNTITHSAASGIVVGGAGGVDNARIQNNVLAYNGGRGVGTDTACPTTSIADHNLAFGNDLGAFSTACPGLDLSGGNLETDPRFVNVAGRDLHLQGGSPAIDYGVLPYSPATDFEGTARTFGAGPDVGAYENNGSSPPPPPPPPPAAGYAATVTADSPRAYWRLGETTGTLAADDHGRRSGQLPQRRRPRHARRDARRLEHRALARRRQRPDQHARPGERPPRLRHERLHRRGLGEGAGQRRAHDLRQARVRDSVAAALAGDRHRRPEPRRPGARQPLRRKRERAGLRPDEPRRRRSLAPRRRHLRPRQRRDRLGRRREQDHRGRVHR